MGVTVGVGVSDGAAAGGWVAVANLLVAVNPGCGWVAVPNPPGVEVRKSAPGSILLTFNPLATHNKTLTIPVKRAKIFSLIKPLYHIYDFADSALKPSNRQSWLRLCNSFLASFHNFDFFFGQAVKFEHQPVDLCIRGLNLVLDHLFGLRLSGKYWAAENHIQPIILPYIISKDHAYILVLPYPLFLTPTILQQPNTVDYLMWLRGNYPNQSHTP
jgi:hypothetical protein